MSHHIIIADDLHFAYPDGTQALRGISFQIHHGEAVALVGSNGAGKSTLLLHLIGCCFPAKGELRIGDFPVTRQNLPAVRRTVGMVFQDPDDQLFMPTVFDDVAFGPLNLGMPPGMVGEHVRCALARMGVEHLQDRPPYKLSSGEKRAVAIAAVLSMSPDILIMDEPSANLDPKSRKLLIGQLRSFEHTRIVATHDLDMALDLCTRTIVLHRGMVAADGPTADILGDSALLESCHLERPLRLQGCPICGRSGSAAQPLSPEK